MTKEEIELIAAAAGRAAARETLIQIGANPDRPLDMQADFAHLRRWRLISERSIMAAAWTVVGLAAAALWNWLASLRH